MMLLVWKNAVHLQFLKDSVTLFVPYFTSRFMGTLASRGYTGLKAQNSKSCEHWSLGNSNLDKSSNKFLPKRLFLLPLAVKFCKPKGGAGCKRVLVSGQIRVFVLMTGVHTSVIIMFTDASGLPAAQRWVWSLLAIGSLDSRRTCGIPPRVSGHALDCWPHKDRAAVVLGCA